ncbi:MAG: sterol desaturase/sphingolipid hydroxylase (fatty acid hydroxylase superfamily), partial [Flavobacteriales bacterium]
KVKGSFWSFHWHTHHRACRKHAHIDDDYNGSVLQWNGQGKEAAAIALGSAAFLPLLPVAPWFVGGLWYSAANYYVRHRRSHLDPEWAKVHLTWHYDHHMGTNQHANWCVTRPWCDIIMGTHRPYLGTWRAKQDAARNRSAIERKAARAASALVSEAA